ncbi:MAG: hypothetical protein WAO35_11415 [Terriglobia bacterium]
MSLQNMGNIIAERALTLLEDNGNTRQVSVRLGEPQASPNHDEYHCSIQFVGLGDEKVRQIFGIDAFQALQLTLRYISFRPHHYRKESNLILYAWEQGDDMGFPEYPQDKS